MLYKYVLATIAVCLLMFGLAYRIITSPMYMLKFAGAVYGVVIISVIIGIVVLMLKGKEDE